MVAENIQIGGSHRSVSLAVVIAIILDFACILWSMAMVCDVLDRSWDVHAFPAISATALFLVLAEVLHLYRPYRAEWVRVEFFRVLLTWILALIALLMIAYFSKISDVYSRLAIVSWAVAVPMMLLGWRTIHSVAIAYIYRFGYSQYRTVAVAGISQNGIEVANLIGKSGWLGLKMVGFYDDRASPKRHSNWSGEITGDFDALIDQVIGGQVQVVYISLPLRSAERIRQLLDRLANTTASIYIVPEPFWTDVMRGQWVHLASLPTISVFETPLNGVNSMVKRIEDLLLASAAITVLAVPMLLIAAAIRFTSPGPVLFKQRRYGLDGREIEIWKFRSMIHTDHDDLTQADRNDPRFTTVGRFIRRTSLDELPQLFNVLQGKMSVVGPRPHAVEHNEHYRTLIKGYMLRHKVPPGITGWAQVNGLRGKTATVDKMKQRVSCDLWYIQNWSVFLDFKIIFLTGIRVARDRNAY